MATRTIQAIHIHQYGGPEQLRLEQVSIPQPQEGEVLIRVHSVGILPAEWKIRRGLFHSFFPVSFPYIMGSACSGVIEEVGPGVTDLKVGQAVFGRSNKGAYTEYTTIAQENLALKPENLSFDEAATISGGATTAWTALFENAQLQAEQRILIHAAAGGVGSYAVQFAHLKGAHVIGTASTANIDYVYSLGAESVLDYTSTPFEQGAQDVDVVLDAVGGETLHRSMHVVKQGGILVSLLEQPDQEMAQQLGIRAMKNTAALPFPSTSLLQTIAHLIAEGQVKAEIAKIFPFHEAAQAHQLSEIGHGRGRIVLHIAD